MSSPAPPHEPELTEATIRTLDAVLEAAIPPGHEPHAEAPWSGAEQTGRSKVPSTLGPIALESGAEPAQGERNGRDVLATEYLSALEEGSSPLDALQGWWLAAKSALLESPSDRREFDIVPRQFTVGIDGAWHHVPSGLTMRFALPLEVVAFRALVEATSDSALWVGCLGRLAADACLADAVDLLMADLGLTSGPATVLGWVEFEADTLVRRGIVMPDRGRVRAWLRARLATPLVVSAEVLPAGQRLAVALWAVAAPAGLGVRAGQAEDLEHALADKDAQLEQRAEGLKQRTDQVRRLRAIRERQTKRIGDLDSQALRRAEIISRQRSELARQAAIIKRLRQDPGQAHSSDGGER